MKIPAKLFLLPVVSLMLVVAASSQADEALFSKSSQALESLWSGVLGCHDAGDTQGFVPRDLYNSDGISTDASGVPGDTGRRDYSECARQSLRNTASRMLVDTIEDAVRTGGVALLEEQFRLDSSISWVWDEDVSGEIDAVIPVWGKWNSDGTGSAFFMQPGAVLWNGIEGVGRIDTNLGFVLRTYLDQDTAVGGSVFFDYDLERGHNRLGAGMDVQSGIVHAGVNYYHPFGGWRKGRELVLDGTALRYEEQAQRGLDFRLGFTLLDRIYLDGAFGVWRFEGDREEAKSDWHSSYGITGRLRVYPGLFLEGGYESHDEKDSLGGRWNAGLTLSLLLPGLKGVEGGGGGMAKPNLWRLVEREKRILYEERLDIIPSVTEFTVAAGMSVEEGRGLATTFEFDKPLEREVTVVFSATPRSTADPGDYTLSATTTVTPPETPETSQAGQGRSVTVGGAQTHGENGLLEVTLPQYTSSVTLTVTVMDDELSETDEIIELAATTTGANSRYARFNGLVRVTIPRNDDYHIGFAEPSSRVEEGAGAVTTHLLLRLGRPAPDGGVPITVSATGATGDITFTSPTNLTVPAGTDEGLVPRTAASVEVTINADTTGEGPEEVFFTIEEGSNFPASPWRLEPGAIMHTLTIGANDNTIGFAATGTGVNLASYDEADGAATRTVEITGVAAPAGGIPLTWTATSGDTPSVDISRDITATRGNFSIPAGETSATFNVNIVNDDVAELSESVRLTIGEGANFPDGYSITSPDNTFSINASDNTVQFESVSSNLEETNTGGITVPVQVNFPYAAGDIEVGLGVSGSAGSDEYDIDIQGAGTYSPGTPGVLTIPQGTGAVNIRVRSQGTDNMPELAENIILTLSERSSPDQLPDGWMLGSRTVHTVTIPENEQPRGGIGFAGGNATSASENQRVTLAVESSNPADEDLHVTWTITTGAADVADPDTGTVTISNGSRRAELSFTIESDMDPEDAEDIVVTLTRDARLPTAWLLSGNTTHTITIPANDRSVSFMPASATETEVAGGGTRDLTLMLNDPAPAGGLPLRITDAAGSDPNNELTLSAPNNTEATWAPASNTFTILAGQTTAVLRIAFAEDADFNQDVYTLSFAEGNNFPSVDGWEIVNRSFVLTVEDPEPNRVSFAPTDQANNINLTDVNEGDNLSLTVVVSGGNPSEALNFNWSVVDNDNDVTDPDRGDLTIATSTDRVTFNVPARDDSVDMELPESFTVMLGGNLPQGFRFGDVQHEFTINANGNTVTFAGPSPASPIAEGESATITATINKAIPVNTTSSDRTITVTTTGGDAERGQDYRLMVGGTELTGNTWTLPTGADTGAETREAVLTIQTLNTPSTTTNRSFTLGLAANNLPTGWSIPSDLSEQITITNDDMPTIGFGSGTSSVEEGAASHTIPFHIVNSGSFGGNFDVTITATGDIGGGIMASNTVSISGLQNQGWTIQTLPDNMTAGLGGTVTLTLASVSDSGWVVDSTRSSHVLTLTDSDAEVRNISFVGTGHTIATETPGGNMTYSVDISVTGTVPAPADAFTLPVTIATGGTPATFSEDYTIEVGGNPVSVSGGEFNLSVSTDNVSGGMLRLDFTIIDDSTFEVAETIVLTLRQPSDNRWSLLGNPPRHVLHIPLNDATVGFASSSGSEATEGASTDPNANPSRSAEVSIDISAGVTTFDLDVGITGDAEAGDYTITAITATNSANVEAELAGENLDDGVISVPSDTIEVAFVVTAVDDNDADDETINFTLSGTLPRGFEFADNMHTVTIRDKGRVVAFTDATATATEQAGSVQTTLTVTPAPTTETTIPITVNRDETDYTLTAGGTAITGTTGNVTFAANANEVTLVLSATNDTDDSGGTITVAVGSLGVGYVEGDQDSWVVTINDNDASTVNTVGFVADRISVLETPVPLTEGETASTRLRGGELKVGIAVKHPNGDPFTNADLPGGGLHVTITSSDGDEDDIMVAGGSSFNLNTQLDGSLGEGVAVIPVTIRDDTVPEGAEVFTLTINPGSGFPSGYEIPEEDKTVEITILPSDNTIGFADETDTIYEDVGTHGVKVVLSSPAPSGLQQDGILVSLSSDKTTIIENTRGPSYTVEEMPENKVYLIPSGVTEYVLPVTVKSGAISGASSEVTLELGLAGENNPSDWTIAGMQTLTVRKSVGTVGFAASSVELTEGELGALVITLSRPAPAGGLNFFLSDRTNERDLIIGKGTGFIGPNGGENSGFGGFGDGVGSEFFTPFTGTGSNELAMCREDEDLEYPNGGCGIVHVPAGATEVVVPVRAYDDAESEVAESYTLTLSEPDPPPGGTDVTPKLPDGWSFSTTTTAVNIAASDNTVHFSLTGARITEGAQTTFNIFTSTPSNLPSGRLAIPITAVPSGESQFIGGVTGGEVVLESGSNPPGRANVTIRAVGDNVREVEKTVIVSADESALPPGWSFGPQGTIAGFGREPYNEFPVVVTDTSGTLGVVGFETDESTIIEGGSGQDIQVKLVSTVAPLAGTGGFSVNITPEVDGTTNQGTDGAITVTDATSGTANVATFAEGATTATINVAAADDSVLDATNLSLTLAEGTGFPSGWELGRTTHLARIREAEIENFINVVTRYRTASEGDSFDIALDIPDTPRLTNSEHNLGVSLSIDRCDRNPSGDVCVDMPNNNILTQSSFNDGPNGGNDNAVFTVRVIDDDEAEGVEEVDITFRLTRTNLDPNPDMPSDWTPGELVTTLRIEGSDQTVGFTNRTAELDLGDSTTLTLPVTLSHNAPSPHTLDPDGTPDSGDELTVGGLRLLVTANHPKIVFDNSSLPAYQRGSLSPQQTIVTVPEDATSTDVSVPFNADDFDDGNAQIVRFSMAPVRDQLYSSDPSTKGIPNREPWVGLPAGLPGGLYPGWEIGNDVTDVTILPPRTIGFETYYSRVDEGGTSQVEMVLSRPAPSGGLTARVVSNNTEVLKFGTTAAAATDTFDVTFPVGETSVMVDVFAVDDSVAHSNEKRVEYEDREAVEFEIPANAGNSVDLTVIPPSGWSQAKPQPYGIASIYQLHSVFIDDDDDIKIAGWELLEAEVTEGGNLTLRVELSENAPSGSPGLSFFATAVSRKGPDARFPGSNSNNSINYQFTATPGSNIVTTNISISNDSDVQGTRYADLTLSFDSNPDDEWSVNPLRETLLLKILDNDGHTVSIDTAASTSTSFEGDPGAKLVLSLSAPAPAGNRGAGVVPGSSCTKEGSGPCTYPTYTGGLGVTIHSSDIADARTNPLTVVIPEGRTTHEVPLSVLRDTVVEPNGSTVEFRLALNVGYTQMDDGGTPNDPSDDTWMPDVSGWRIGTPSTHTMTISPDDTKVVYFADGSSVWHERDGTVEARLRFTERPAGDVVLALTSADTDNVTVASSVTISPSDVDSNRVATVPFTIVNDNLYEENESVAISFTVTSPSDWNAGLSTHYVRIHPSDNRPGNKYVGFSDLTSRATREGERLRQIDIRTLDGVRTSDFPSDSSSARFLIEYLHADGTDASGELENVAGGQLPMEVTTPESFNMTLRAKADADDEGDEVILIRLKEDPANTLPEGWKLRDHEITVRLLDPRQMRFVFTPALEVDPSPFRDHPRWEIDDNVGTASFELVTNRPAERDNTLIFRETNTIGGFQIRGTSATGGGTAVTFPKGATRLEVVADITDIASSTEGILQMVKPDDFDLIDILDDSTPGPNQSILVEVRNSN